jgi:hypothetical protein
MTTLEMAPLLDHPDPKVRKMALEYATLWDASTDLCTAWDSDALDYETLDTPAGDAHDALVKVLKSQPNEKKDDNEDKNKRAKG